MKYKKWRDLTINLSDIPFKKIKLLKELNYPPAGNDVVECLVDINGNKEYVFIKYERSKVSDFYTEYKNLNIINKYLKETPKVIEYGIYNDKKYIVLEKKNGKRLSDIFKLKVDKEKYLYTYGNMLSKIHNIKGEFNKALQRPINDYPNGYKKYDSYSNKIIEWLKANQIQKDYNTFIHGDFHYGNVLFRYGKISGILDLEYSGMGFKEQDIAWALVLRPGQKFMDNLNDIKSFLKGYNNSFDYNKFKWCYVNSSIHFYLMNINNEKYKKKIKELIDKIIVLNNIEV